MGSSNRHPHSYRASICMWHKVMWLLHLFLHANTYIHTLVYMHILLGEIPIRALIMHTYIHTHIHTQGAGRNAHSCLDHGSFLLWHGAFVSIPLIMCVCMHHDPIVLWHGTFVSNALSMSMYLCMHPGLFCFCKQVLFAFLEYVMCVYWYCVFVCFMLCKCLFHGCMPWPFLHTLHRCCVCTTGVRVCVYVLLYRS